MLQTDTIAAVVPPAIREWSDLFNWPALTRHRLRVVGALVVCVICHYALRHPPPRERTVERDGWYGGRSSALARW
jgi:hypothetical protein